ncbi:hypothetical protein NG798_17385 [Ancylothrix sp. C2]|uniref:hypothetical protein n=1 Tax=Ancylothrix sp. D3o TaxID=2953691 RepID=UPI0021BB26BB|nr:hypothetical protein [Ancylothrix sp. D3o]MCT7951580.1 hypothetical protein [Ancylothrix sp. D3o]
MESTETQKSLTHPHHRHAPLEIAEYASVCLSAVGSVAAAFSQQVILAALPLTMAVSLNLINRSRITQKSQLPPVTNTGEITSNFDALFPFSPTPELLEATPNFQEEIIQLQRSVAELQDSTAVALAEIRHYFAEQVQGISHGEPVDLNPIHQSLDELRSLTERLQTDALTHADWERMNVQFLLMQERIAQASNAATISSAENNGEEIQEFLTQIQANQQEQIEDLRRRLEELEEKNQNIVKPYLQRLVTQVKQLQTEQQNSVKTV